MKEFEIPMIDQYFFLFIGEDDYYKWLEKAKKENLEYIYEEQCTGLTGGTTSGRFIWIGNSKDDNLIYHEISHYLHWLYNLMACPSENEFKSYISAWVHSEIFKYINQMDNKA